jgi:rhamnosyltransferase
MSSPRVSILLPTWNGEVDLKRLLPVLQEQRVEGGWELVAVDSSSSDASVRLLEEAGARVEIISKEEFGHGQTRNQLARLARGRELVFLSQDALPSGPDFLEQLLKPLREEGVAGSYARILPHTTDDALTSRTVLSAPESAENPGALAELTPEQVWQLPGAERLEHLRFNNVASAVRADVFREIEFPLVPFGEDIAWAARALHAGWRVRFAPQALVYHAHRYTPSQAFERYRLDAAFHREIHGHHLRRGVFSLLKGILFEMREDLRFVAGNPGAPWADLLRSPGLRGAQVLGQFWGSRGWGKAFWPDSMAPGDRSLG